VDRAEKEVMAIKYPRVLVDVEMGWRKPEELVPYSAVGIHQRVAGQLSQPGTRAGSPGRRSDSPPARAAQPQSICRGAGPETGGRARSAVSEEMRSQMGRGAGGQPGRAIAESQPPDRGSLVLPFDITPFHPPSRAVFASQPPGRGSVVLPFDITPFHPPSRAVVASQPPGRGSVVLPFVSAPFLPSSRAVVAASQPPGREAASPAVGAPPFQLLPAATGSPEHSTYQAPSTFQLAREIAQAGLERARKGLDEAKRFDPTGSSPEVLQSIKEIEDNMVPLGELVKQYEKLQELSLDPGKRDEYKAELRKMAEMAEPAHELERLSPVEYRES
jgi:hypothetical protein